MVEVFFTHRTFRNIVFTDEAEIPRALRVFSTGDFLWCSQWGIRADFRNMDSIFRLTTYRWSMGLIFWGSVVPKSTNDWWNMSFQLPRFAKIRGLKYFRLNWKLHCKLRSWEKLSIAQSTRVSMGAILSAQSPLLAVSPSCGGTRVDWAIDSFSHKLDCRKDRYLRQA